MLEEDMQRAGEPKGPGANDDVDAEVDPGHQTGGWNCGMELEDVRAAVLETRIRGSVERKSTS